MRKKNKRQQKERRGEQTVLLDEFECLSAEMLVASVDPLPIHLLPQTVVLVLLRGLPPYLFQGRESVTSEKRSIVR
jgi:hypothetical protein